ncbi:SAM-dependent methyltransferase [Streptomyces sp. NPDC005953]|uniref:SAM-dependent methyltransferase n=1 Tax=unclassified Streptomyces TaxID=2593676 RepID=UPI0033DC8A32
MHDGENFDSDALDTGIPSVARMYDHLLGGVDHYQADRDACGRLLEVVPDSRALALNNRAFLRRVVGYLATEHGIRQFLDHGSGLPTVDNVHQVAQRIDPSSRVVYIDNDPIVLAHGKTRLDQNDRTAVVQADMRDSDLIFGHPEVERLILKGEKTAALFVSVMHCLKDDQVVPLLERVRSKLAPGSLFVICQLVSERAEIRESVSALMKEATQDNWGRVRTKAEVRTYFAGLTILEPGLMNVTEWRAESEVVPRQRTEDWEEWGGIGRLG